MMRTAPVVVKNAQGKEIHFKNDRSKLAHLKSEYHNLESLAEEAGLEPDVFWDAMRDVKKQIEQVEANIAYRQYEIIRESLEKATKQSLTMWLRGANELSLEQMRKDLRLEPPEYLSWLYVNATDYNPRESLEPLSPEFYASLREIIADKWREKIPVNLAPLPSDDHRTFGEKMMADSMWGSYDLHGSEKRRKAYTRRMRELEVQEVEARHKAEADRAWAQAFEALSESLWAKGDPESKAS
jgi:hypothetical protein